jgi:hypothetical protein
MMHRLEGRFPPSYCDYNDIILRRPDGVVEIYAYPVEDFPTAWSLCALEAEGAIWIFASGLKRSWFAHGIPRVESPRVSFDPRELVWSFEP